MKTLMLIGCCIATLLSVRCNKSEKPMGSAISTSKPTQLSDSIRLQVIADWQQFIKDAGESLVSAEEKAYRLKLKLTTANHNEKVLLQRIYKSSNKDIEKLQISLLKEGIKFRSAIRHLSPHDALKNESFRTDFKAKLDDLHTKLDNGLSII